MSGGILYTSVLYPMSQKVVTHKRILYGITVLTLMAVALVCLVVSHIQNPETLTVSFLDVGQGDAIFIESPAGRQVLVDAGADRKVLRELGSVLPIYDRSIDMIVSTHADKDHIGGTPRVLGRYTVDTVVTSPLVSDTSHVAALKEEITKERAVSIRPVHGQTYYLGGGVRLEVLFPDRLLQASADNTASVVMRLVYKQASVLLTGDIPDAVEEYLIDRKIAALNADVLKVAHHGSDTSSSMEFVRAASPAYAVIQAGPDNPYGHPDAVVLDRLKRAGARVLCTCKEGSITFQTNGDVFKRVH